MKTSMTTDFDFAATTLTIHERVDRTNRVIKEKKKQVKKWRSFISGFSSDAYNIEQEIKDLEALIEYDEKALKNITTFLAKKRNNGSL